MKYVTLGPSVLVVATVVLAGCSQKAQLQGVDGMASQVPASSLLFVGFDARDKLPKEVIRDLDQVKDRPEIARSLQNLTRQTGVEGLKLFKAFEPAGWGVIVDPQGKKNLKELALVGAIWVRDRKEAEACLAQAMKAKPEKKEELRGNSIETYQVGYSTCFAEPFLLVSNRPEGIRAILERQGPSLAEDAGYKAAHQQLFQNHSMAFFYSGMGPVLQLAAAGSSKPAQQAQGGVRYLAGGVAHDSPYSSKALLSLDPNSSSALIKGLLAAPPSSNALAASVPAQWNFYLMMQLRPPLQALAESATWSPEGTEMLKEYAAACKSAGTSAEQVNRAFEGDVAVSLDLDQYLAQVPSAPPNGVLTWGLRSPADFEALWKKFCRAQGVKTKAEKFGNFQVERFANLPFLVLARRDNQALLVMGKAPDEILKTISQLKPQESMKASPALKPIEQTGGLFALQYDLRSTIQQLQKSGLLGLDPSLAPLKDAVETWSPELWHGHMTVRTEQGAIKAEGAPITVMLATVFQIAFFAGFLEAF